MSDIDWPIVRELFDAVVQLPGAERETRLGRAEVQPEVRAEVERMLRSDEAASGFLESPAPLLGKEFLPRTGTRIGRYVLERVIASGGMGTVFEAVQDEPRRVVALKTLRLGGFSSPERLQRFRFEAEVLGHLRHPSIAQIFEAGTHEDGSEHLPFIAMELVPGARDLLTYAREEGLQLRERLELLLDVCEAVQHGHQKGVIHRDLKPGNILVDAEGRAKVIDFGVARAAGRASLFGGVATQTGQILGTLAYMAPEQLAGSPEAVDVRSDVYALGILLFELIEGRPPHELAGRSPIEALRAIHEEPPRFSASTPRELGWILEKALAKEPERRYGSVSELAADLRRHLRGELVLAGPPSVAYRLSKWVQRNPARSAAAAIGAVAFLVITWLLIQNVRANAALKDERASLASANTALRTRTAVANVLAAGASLQANEVAEAKRRLEACDESLRGWEWRHLKLASDSSLAVLRGHDAPVISVAFGPDGTRIASGSNDNTVRLWDASGESLLVLRGHDSRVGAIAFSSDGTRIASGSFDKTIRLWDAGSGAPLAVLQNDSAVYAVAFSPDGTRVASGSEDESIRLWDVRSGEVVAVLHGHDAWVSALAFSPDGTRIASGSSDDTIRLWDAMSGEPVAVLRGHDPGVNAVAFSPDGSRIASGSSDNTVRSWDARSGEPVAVLRGHDPGVNAVAFSPDGARIASGSDDKTVRLWDAMSGEPVAVLRGHDAGVNAVAFGTDGSRIASGSNDNTIRLWDAASGESVAVLRGHDSWVNAVAFGPDGSHIASASNDKTIRFWDSRCSESVAVLRGDDSPVSGVAFSPDGSRIASGAGDTIRVWNARSGETLAVLRGHDSDVYAVAFSPDGSRIASGSLDKTIRLWDAESGESLAVLRGHDWAVSSVAFDPDSSRIASGSVDKTIRLWDAGSGESVAVLRGHDAYVQAVAFSPDGSRIASGSSDNTVRSWDARSGEPVAVLRGHDSWVIAVAFSPDGSRIASGSVDKTIRLWDAGSGESVAVLRGHASDVNAVAFSPDGSCIASAARGDNAIRMWLTDRESLLALSAGLAAERTRSHPVADAR